MQPPVIQTWLSFVVLALSPSLLSCSDSKAPLRGDSDLGFDRLPKPSVVVRDETGTETETETEERPGSSDGGAPNTGNPNRPPEADAGLDSDFVTEEPADVVWHPCGKGQCTTIQVPVDYADPSLGTLGLRVFVGKSRLASRRGALFFNPGGPGAPVVADASVYFSLLSGYLPTMDIVLMDNRGMGQSTPTDCVDASFLDTRFAGLTDDWSRTQVEELADIWADFNTGCNARMGKSVVENLHSINVARDMDRVRKALREERISVWNVSYGTVQASLYGKLFPEHVGAFVLDSPVYFGDTTHVDDIHDAIAAYDTELSRFLEWCASNTRCGLGTTSAEVNASYDRLRSTLADGVTYRGEVLTGTVLDSVAAGMLMYGEWESFAAVLSDAVRGNFNALVVAATSEDEDPEASHAMWQANFVVRLLDYDCPDNYTNASALAHIQAAMEEHPRMANVYSWHLTACLGWSTRAAEARLDPSDLESAPFLLLTSAHDAATPLKGAENLLAQLNNGSQLSVIQKEGHGVLATHSEGTAEGVDFIGAASSGRTSCSGLSCSSFNDSTLGQLSNSERPNPRLPRIRPRPVRPLVRL